MYVSQTQYIINKTVCVCACVCARVGSFLLSRGFWGLVSGHQAWQQMSVSTVLVTVLLL